MKTMFLTNSFATARENMAYDEDLVQRCLENKEQRIFRFYIWKNPGITYSEKRVPNQDLLSVDASPRVTGGGVVFHSPGDLVFSVVISKDDPKFPKSLKGKMEMVSALIQQGFLARGVEVHMGSREQKNKQDIMFCTTYYNPYELYYGNEKVCGIALRKYRDLVVFQGVIHLCATKDYFSSYSEHYDFVFTKGLSSGFPKGDVEDLVLSFKQKIDTQF